MAVLYKWKIVLNKQLKKIIADEKKILNKTDKVSIALFRRPIFFIWDKYELYEWFIISVEDDKYKVKVKNRLKNEYEEILVEQKRVVFEK